MAVSLWTLLPILGMSISLIGVSILAKREGRHNWYVYLVAGGTMLILLALEFLGIVNVLQ